MKLWLNYNTQTTTQKNHMIHVLTIHWQSEEWIDIQLKYLKQHIREPFRVYTFLNNVPNTPVHREKFFYSSTENIKSHPIKLNLLADMASFAAESEDDYLMFLDGDAFPINSIDEFKSRVFPKHPLAAIQRLENNGDIQPHPCFCMTTVGYWKTIKGDWKAGDVKWTDKFGAKVWDVGGQMLQIMEDNQVDWYKLNRSNNHNLHPLLFGVYENLVYHHGAAFRNPGTRIDRNQVENFQTRLKRFRKAKKFMPKWLARKLFLPLKHQVKNNAANSKKVFQMIQSDSQFYKKLDHEN
jgi:hypothetical protein